MAIQPPGGLAARRTLHIRERTSALQLAECVRTLFALELWQPGPLLYLCSPVLRNPVVLPNRMGQFSALFPEMEADALRLDRALALLAERGVAIRIIHTSQDKRQPTALAALPALEGHNVVRATRSPLQYKGLWTNKLCLRGTLDFTDDGVTLGDEQVDLITDATELQRLRLERDAYWQELA